MHFLFHLTSASCLVLVFWEQRVIGSGCQPGVWRRGLPRCPPEQRSSGGNRPFRVPPMASCFLSSLFPFHWTNTVVKLSAFSTLLGLHQGMHCLSCFSEQTWAHGLPLSRPRSVCLPRSPGRSFISPCIEGRPPASCACPCCADPRAYGQSLWKNGVEKILRVEAAHFHLWSFPSQRTFTVKTELSL